MVSFYQDLRYHLGDIPLLISTILLATFLFLGTAVIAVRTFRSPSTDEVDHDNHRTKSVKGTLYICFSFYCLFLVSLIALLVYELVAGNNHILSSHGIVSRSLLFLVIVSGLTSFFTLLLVTTYDLNTNNKGDQYHYSTSALFTMIVIFSILLSNKYHYSNSYSKRVDQTISSKIDRPTSSFQNEETDIFETRRQDI